MPAPISELKEAEQAAAATTAGASSPPAARSIPPPVSTIAAAGLHNHYIWRKADHFFGSRGPGVDPVSSGAGVPAPSNLPMYARAVCAWGFLFNLALACTNFLVLPLQLLAFGPVLLQAIVARANPGQRVPLARWSPAVLRVVEVIVGWWEGLVSVLLERVMGMRVHLAGDVIPDSARSEGMLILSNHPSTADWVYVWSWLIRQGDMTRLKIVLKGALHSVPILGWCLQADRYLFLARNWEQDRMHMDRMVGHWAGEGAGTEKAQQVQLLLFPEGTDLRPVSYDQSAAFVAKSAAAGGAPLTPLQHLLQPRVTGFVHLIKLLRASGSVRRVVDLTLGSAPLPVTIENLARGAAPAQFHVHTRVWDLAALPTTDEGLAAWLHERWVEKDALLEKFYASSPCAFKTSAAQTELESSIARQMLFTHFSLLAVFGFVFLLHSYALWHRPGLMILLHAALSAVWLFLTRKHKGIDMLILAVDQAADLEQQHMQERQINQQKELKKTK